MEFNNIGAHCNYKNCNEKDFLPFKCPFCGKIYCIDHKSVDQHNCEKSNQNNIVLI